MNPAIKGLGEIALRVSNLDAMQAFYEQVIGLALLQRFDTSAFFKIAEGVAGHTQILALFDRSNSRPYQPPNPQQSSIDHLAFTVTLADFEQEQSRLEQLGLTVTLSTHAWVQWRSLYLHDPEGNVVELVCYDESLK